MDGACGRILPEMLPLDGCKRGILIEQCDACIVGDIKLYLRFEFLPTFCMCYVGVALFWSVILCLIYIDMHFLIFAEISFVEVNFI